MIEPIDWVGEGFELKLEDIQWLLTNVRPHPAAHVRIINVPAGHPAGHPVVSRRVLVAWNGDRDATNAELARAIAGQYVLNPDTTQ